MLAMGLFDVVGSFASQRIAREHALHDKRMAAVEARHARARENARQDALRLRAECKEAYGVVLVHMSRLMDATEKRIRAYHDDEVTGDRWDEIDAGWERVWDEFNNQVQVTYLVSSGDVDDAIDTFCSDVEKWMNSYKVDGKKHHRAWDAFEDAKNAMYADVKL